MNKEKSKPRKSSSFTMSDTVLGVMGELAAIDGGVNHSALIRAAVAAFAKIPTEERVLSYDAVKISKKRGSDSSTLKTYTLGEATMSQLDEIALADRFNRSGVVRAACVFFTTVDDAERVVLYNELGISKAKIARWARGKAIKIKTPLT
ncbi:hypothetical protein ACPV5R_18640 [Vibrio astriarenae]